MATPDLVFLRDMAVVMVAAAVTTVVFHRLRQPVVLGYLLAGVLVTILPFAVVRDRATIEVLGQLGIVFLLFSLGLEFNIGKLRKVGLTAIVAGVLETSFMVWLGYSLGRLFGLPHLTAIFLGAIVAISSTTIILKILTETKQKDEEWAQLIFGILLVEDVLAVLILTILGTAGATGDVSTFQVGTVLVKLAIFLGAALVLGLVVVPRVVSYVARFEIDEVLVVTVLGLAFGMALLANYIGFSTALGAFVMGALIAESRTARDVERKVLPIRDLFTAIFFVTVGMLLDPRAVLANWPLILAMSAAVIVGKVVAASFATFVTGHEPRTALRVGFGLAQIGEFSFVIATLALTLGVADPSIYPVAVAVSAITAFTSPLLLKLAPRAVEAFERRAPKPLYTYASLYGAWVRRLRELGRADPARVAATRAGIRTNLYGAALIGIVAIGVVSLQRIMAFLAPVVPVVLLQIAGLTVVGLVSLPFLYLFTRALRQFVRALAEAALPERVRASETGANVQHVLRRTFFLAGVVMLASLLLVIASPFVPPLPLLLVVALAVAASGVLLYGALVRFHRSVDRTLGEVLTGEGAADEAREERSEILSLIREQYPWDVKAKEVKVPDRCFCSNRSIRDLLLRSETGATLVGIHRGDEHMINPPPETVIRPGDVLVVLGEDSQVEAARELLLAPAIDSGGTTRETAQWREVVLASGSPWVGRSLGATHIRARTGATVIGIVREGERIQNPPASFKLASGDVLLVVGTAAQVARVAEIATGNHGGAGAGGGAPSGAG